MLQRSSQFFCFYFKLKSSIPNPTSPNRSNIPLHYTNPVISKNHLNLLIKPQDNLEIQLRKDAIQELVNQVFQQQHTKKQLLILRLLTKLVNTRVIEVRYVCEYMLNYLVYSSSPSLSNLNNNYLQHSNNNPIISGSISSVSNLKLKPTNTYIWCKILECIRNFIPLHDYKSCRDIFKMLLEVVKRIPHSNSSYPPHLETELLFIKSARKHKFLTDYNTFDDEYASVNSISNSSMVTDDIKLESLYEVLILLFADFFCIIFYKNFI